MVQLNRDSFQQLTLAMMVETAWNLLTHHDSVVYVQKCTHTKNMKTMCDLIVLNIQISERVFLYRSTVMGVYRWMVGVWSTAAFPLTIKMLICWAGIKGDKISDILHFATLSSLSCFYKCSKRAFIYIYMAKPAHGSKNYESCPSEAKEESVML